MVLLRSDRLDTIPKDATILTEQEALKHQWEQIDSYDREGSVWSLQYGANILGVLSGLTGVYINHHYRSRLRLGSFGAFSTYLPIVALPTLVSTVYHKAVRASMFQVGCGVVYPAILAPFASYMFATRHFTFRLPPISKPKELFALYKKMTKPLSMFISIAVGFHMIIAMAMTQKEILDHHRMEQDGITEELLS